MSAKSLLVGVNCQCDPANPSDLERKHIPAIEAPEAVRRGQPFDVRIEIGKTLPHPDEPGHYIEFVDLFADETYLARVSLTAGTTRPNITLRVVLDHAFGELRAYARCNLHGTWLGRRAIAVQP